MGGYGTARNGPAVLPNNPYHPNMYINDLSNLTDLQQSAYEKQVS